ncbi:hypothetical protein FQZ97_1110820 [compost metagenome]
MVGLLVEDGHAGLLAASGVLAALEGDLVVADGELEGSVVLAGLGVEDFLAGGGGAVLRCIDTFACQGIDAIGTGRRRLRVDLVMAGVPRTPLKGLILVLAPEVIRFRY